MEHRLRRKQLNSDTDASNRTCLKKYKKNEKSIFLENVKMKKTVFKKENMDKRERKKRTQRGGYLPETAQKMIFFFCYKKS